MDDFNLEGHIWALRSCYKDESCGPESDLAADNIVTSYRFWVLGHNFDVVATILTMAHLSWQQGFESGRNLAFFDEHDGWTPNTDPIYIKPFQLRQDSAD